MYFLTQRKEWMRVEMKRDRNMQPNATEQSIRYSRGDRVHEVYRTLRDLIVRGTLGPGAGILEADVVARLGVSRTPVRSALLKLQNEGYVVATRNNGRSRSKVASLTKEDAREVMQIMAELEGLAGRSAALLARDQRTRLVAELRKINTQLKNSADASGKAFSRLDQAFHGRYVEAAAGPRLLALHQSIKPQADRYIWLYVTALADQISTSVREHEVIIRSIDAGKPNAAQRAVRTNWRNAAERLARVMEHLGERGHW